MTGKADIPKVIKDGKVAVIFSRSLIRSYADCDTGFGWYTEIQHDAPSTEFDPTEVIFDPGLVDLVNKKEITGPTEASVEKIEKYCAARWPELMAGSSIYKYGVPQLRVAWLPKGTRFLITENNGSEYIITTDNLRLEA